MPSTSTIAPARVKAFLEESGRLERDISTLIRRCRQMMDALETIRNEKLWNGSR